MKSLPELKQSTRQDLIDVLLAHKITKILGKEDSSSGDIDFNKLLAFGVINQMFRQQSNIDPNLLIALMNKGSDSDAWDKFLAAYLQQQAQTQQTQLQFNQQLIATLFGQRLTEQDRQVKEIKESLEKEIKKIDDRIRQLQEEAKNQPSASQDLIDMLEYEMKKKEVLEKFAETFKPERIVQEGGKIDWGKLAERMLSTFEKVAEARARMPTYQPVQEIPIPQSQTQQIAIPQQTIEAQPVQEIQAQAPSQPIETQEMTQAQAVQQATEEKPLEFK